MELVKKQIVKSVVEQTLSAIFTDGAERQEIINKIFDEVVSDIEETADNEFNFSDVSIALQRVLLNAILHKKVFVVSINEVSDFEQFDHEPEVFEKLVDAQEYFNSAKEDAKKDYIDGDDGDMVVDKESDTYFCLYNQEEGWSHTHYEVQIDEKEIE